MHSLAPYLCKSILLRDAVLDLKRAVLGSGSGSLRRFFFRSLECTRSWPQAFVHYARIPRCVGALLVSFLSCLSGCEERSIRAKRLSSGRWFSGSKVLLLNCWWEFPVSRMVFTPEIIALTEETGLRPYPGTIMAEI